MRHRTASRAPRPGGWFLTAAAMLAGAFLGALISQPAARPLTAAAGAGTGLIGGLLIGIIRTLRSGPGLQTTEGVERDLSLPVVATVPVMLTPREREQGRRRQWRWNLLAGTTLLTCGILVVWALLR